MIGPVWTFDGANGDDNKGYFKAYGLGVHWLEDGKGGQWIGHVGEAYSLRAGFWVNRKARKGFAHCLQGGVIERRGKVDIADFGCKSFGHRKQFHCHGLRTGKSW